MENLLQVILLAVIEGITEFLPISSTGHLLIAEHWLGERSDLFNIAIQAGAVMAVVIIYRNRLVNIALHWREKDQFSYLSKLSVAFAITASLGLVMTKMGWTLPHQVQPIAWASLIGALVIFGGEWHLQRHAQQDIISWSAAIAVGFAQIIAAVCPGTSRSAATILTAMFLGISRSAATEFSFLVGIPTMFAATGLSLWKHYRTSGLAGRHEWLDLIVGTVVSAVVAFVVVKWLLRYVQSHSFNAFAWYRLVLGLGLLLWAWSASA